MSFSSHLATIMATDQAGLPVLDALEESFLYQAGKRSNFSNDEITLFFLQDTPKQN